MNARQQRFGEEYLVDANARQAAVRAGYSARSAEVNGPRLLRNAQVATAVEEKQKERAERTQVTVDRVVEELALIAFGTSATSSARTATCSTSTSCRWTPSAGSGRSRCFARR